MVKLDKDLIDEVTRIVVDGGRHSLRWFRPLTRHDAANRGLVESKSGRHEDFDPVTEADRVVEDLIRQRLSELFPDHAITGEERGTTGSGDDQWIIDPIDGTRAFVCGQPMWGTLVGLLAGRQPAAGWMYLPVLDECYVGVGPGSWLIRPGSAEEMAPIDLTTSSTSSLDDAVVLCTHPSMFAPGPERDRFEQLADQAKMVRFGGDCMNYALLASGEVDLVVENQLAVHDIVPLIPIVANAGGVITDRNGLPPVDGGFVIAAANQLLHHQASRILAPETRPSS